MADKLFNQTSQWFDDELFQISQLHDQVIELKNALTMKRREVDNYILKSLTQYAPTESLAKALAQELFINNMCSIGVIAQVLNVAPDEVVDVFTYDNSKRGNCPECNEMMIMDGRHLCDECTLRKMPYQEYLRSDHWQNVRKEALLHADYRCQLCNAKKGLHVHHRTYENRGKESFLDVIVLCSNCHAKFHNKLPE